MSDLLWHYTRQDGLRGILADKEFWATDVRFLNDGREYRYGLELLIIEATKSLPNSAYKRSLLQTLQFNTNESRYGHPFVVSFSANEDDLSQWRAYAPFGVGFAIGIDRDSLEVSAVASGANWVDCSYLPNAPADKKVDIIEKALDAILEWSKDPFDNAKDDQDLFDASSGITHVVTTNEAVEHARIAVKHAAFRHEQETRIWTRRSENSLRFRNGRATLLPYISLPLVAKGARIIEVMLGPSSNPELSQRAVEMLCESSEINAHITRSGVPYREL